MDRAPASDQPNFMNPKRADRHRHHQQNPSPADRAVRQCTLWRGELNEAEREGCHRRERVKRNRGRGAQQRPKVHLALSQNGMSSSMSLLRAPAATARRGAAADGPPAPKSPLESSEPRLPPPPLRPSSIVRAELKPCSTTSVEYL